MRAPLLALCSVVALAGAAGLASADDKFHPVPAAPGQTGRLDLRVVSYGHSVHGEIVVEVKNPGPAPVTFVASGLYFTPDDNYEAQRLAMVGGIRAGSEDAPTDAVTIAAGGTRKMRFDVYCIDESRHAPPIDQAYTLASARLPARLTTEIVAQTRDVLGQVELRPDDGEQSSIQSRVWEARRIARFRLLGERR